MASMPCSTFDGWIGRMTVCSVVLLGLLGFAGTWERHRNRLSGGFHIAPVTGLLLFIFQEQWRRFEQKESRQEVQGVKHNTSRHYSGTEIQSPNSRCRLLTPWHRRLCARRSKCNATPAHVRFEALPAWPTERGRQMRAKKGGQFDSAIG